MDKEETLREMESAASVLRETIAPMIMRVKDGSMDDEELKWWIDNLPRGLFDNVITVLRGYKRHRLWAVLAEQEEARRGVS